MGMNHEGEIDYLTRIALPTVALVNNAQRAHVGILGSLEAIARAKGEIYAGLKPGGVALINADDPYATAWKALNLERRMVTFGLGDLAHVRGQMDGAQLRIITPSDAFAVTLQVAGEHNARNAVAAAAAAFALEIPPHAIQQGLNGFAGVPGRQQHRVSGHGATVIDDTYNANPDSMAQAVELLAARPGRRIAVLGDMLELGTETAALHAGLGTKVAQAGIDWLFACGPHMAHAARAAGAAGMGERARHFASLEPLVAALQNLVASGDSILVKGSRGSRMERVVTALAAEVA